MPGTLSGFDPLVTVMDNLVTSSQAIILPKPKMHLHLLYLDGIRGLAALYVLLYHIWGEIAWSAYADKWPAINHGLFRLISYGYFSVSVFIVLSGYSLMLPVVRSEDKLLVGGFSRYIKRRFLRIVPPYYAAIGFSLLMVLLVPVLQRAQGVHWDASLPAFSWDGIVSHVFLIHNLSAKWIYLINTPMWSVATEWQIYFFFPVIFLPIWRVAGWVATVCVGWTIGLGIFVLWRAQVAHAAPWYLGLFAMGVATAVINEKFSASSKDFGKISGILTCAIIGIIAFLFAFVPQISRYGIIMDALVGVMSCLLLIHCAASSKGANPSWIVRLFQSSLAVRLGGASYSIYLVHAPILAAIFAGMRHYDLSAPSTLALLFAVALPTSLTIAYLFHCMFERPFISARANRPIREKPPTSLNKAAIQEI